MSKLAEKLIKVARSQVGVREVGDTNCGPIVDVYKAATWLDPKLGWPWCAAFVCWCVKEAMKEGVYTFTRPRTASAFGFIDWSLAQDNSTQTKRWPMADIKAGDIVVFDFSHIGIAISDAKSGKFLSCEGNTNQAGSREGSGVFEKLRDITRVRARIRFTV
jgi:hypothetical protein